MKGLALQLLSYSVWALWLLCVWLLLGVLAFLVGQVL